MSDEDEDKWLSASSVWDAFDKGWGSAFGLVEQLAPRARDGILETWAKECVRGKNKSGAGVLPAEFWWAGGKGAMTASWTTGDFQTFVPTNGIYGPRWVAYDVRFKRDQIAAMLPLVSVERRAGRSSYESADSILLDEVKDLIKAGLSERLALERVIPRAIGASPEAARDRLTRRLRGQR